MNLPLRRERGSGKLPMAGRNERKWAGCSEFDAALCRRPSRVGTGHFDRADRGRQWNGYG